MCYIVCVAYCCTEWFPHHTKKPTKPNRDLLAGELLYIFYYYNMYFNTILLTSGSDWLFGILTGNTKASWNEQPSHMATLHQNNNNQHM